MGKGGVESVECSGVERRARGATSVLTQALGGEDARQLSHHASLDVPKG